MHQNIKYNMYTQSYPTDWVTFDFLCEINPKVHNCNNNSTVIDSILVLVWQLLLLSSHNIYNEWSIGPLIHIMINLICYTLHLSAALTVAISAG